MVIISKQCPDVASIHLGPYVMNAEKVKFDNTCNLILLLFILQEVVMTTGVMQIDDCLLEGHLGITKELVAMQSVQKRFFIGAENGGCGLIKVCIFTCPTFFYQFTYN